MSVVVQTRKRRRGIARAVRGRARRSGFGAVALLLALASALGVAGAQLLQDLGPGAASPASGHAEVIAQGVAPMPAGEVAWRVTRATAPRPQDRPEDRSLGFVLADGNALQLGDPATGVQVRLAAGEASFVAEGDGRLGFALGGKPVAYYRIALVPADEAAHDPGDEPVFAGDAFAAPEGNRDLDLVRDVLAADEEVELALGAASAPTLFLVTAGAVEVIPATDRGAESIRLAAGQATSVAGGVLVRAGDEGAAFVAAVVGPEVPPVPTQPASPGEPATPAAATGSISVTTYLCPAGYAGKVDAEICAEPGAGIDVTVALYASEFGLTDVTDETGTVAFDDLGPGEYLVLTGVPGDVLDRFEIHCFAEGAPGAPEPRQVTFTGYEPNGVRLLLEQGAEVACTFFLVPTDARGAGGTIALTVQLCPSADTPTDQCEFFTDPYTVATLTGPVYLSTDASSEVPVRIHGVNWVWGEEGGVPFGVYYLNTKGINVPAEYALDRVEGALGGSGLDWTIEVGEANPNAIVNVVYVSQVGGEDDPDADGATNEQEAQYRTDPKDPDTDDDGASDGQEINYGEPGPSPILADSDGDGLLDGVEMNETGTNPAGGDSDGDGLADGDEVAAGTDPLDPNDPPGGDGQAIAPAA